MARELLKPENFVHYAGKAVQFYLEKAKLEGTPAKNLYSEIYAILNSIQDSKARRDFISAVLGSKKYSFTFVESVVS